MQHPFLSWRSDYEAKLRGMVVTRKQAVEQACLKILRPENWKRYQQVQDATDVPAAFIGALDYRESDCDPSTGLGQGDPWNQVSKHVPRGCGPFSSWVGAAIFYVNFDHLNDNSVAWSQAYECWKGEIWNGLGYRAHGLPSPYLWAGTNWQHDGLYKTDGHFDRSAIDTRVGIMPIIVHIGQLDPAFAVPFTSGDAASAGPASIAPALWVQQNLNRLNAVTPKLAPLAEDGNYGRRTREAVRQFQLQHGLTPDGLCGPKTAGAILRAGA